MSRANVAVVVPCTAVSVDATLRVEPIEVGHLATVEDCNTFARLLGGLGAHGATAEYESPMRGSLSQWTGPSPMPSSMP